VGVKELQQFFVDEERAEKKRIKREQHREDRKRIRDRERLRKVLLDNTDAICDAILQKVAGKKREWGPISSLHPELAEFFSSDHEDSWEFYNIFSAWLKEHKLDTYISYVSDDYTPPGIVCL